MASYMTLARSAAAATRPQAPLRAPRPARARPTRSVVARAKDFDSILADFASEFEKYPQDKKVAVAGWGAAALGAFVFAEKIMHTVVFDFLIGGPVQMLGLLALPGIALKFIDGKDLAGEAGDYVNSIAKRLPGLDK